MELTERKKQILKRVVEDYIAAAEPVGSKVLCEEMGGSISSATIRNELADLVEMGYLEQPHTSAGRVPSPKGYRLYVNELMEQHELSEAETRKINETLHGKLAGIDNVMSQAGQMVSSIVNYPTYTVTAGRKELSVKRFELVSVDEKSFIVVVMTEDVSAGERVDGWKLLADGKALLSGRSIGIKRIRTLEGLLNPDREPSDIQKAFMEEAAIQCGFCTPGFLMTAVEILDSGKLYSDEELRKLLSGHLCRCTGYENSLKAVKKTMYRRLGMEVPAI